MSQAGALWGIDLPTAWPDAPQLMSVSTANEIEACPRRWLLGNAPYPSLWSNRGYPPRANIKTLGYLWPTHYTTLN